MLIIVFLIISVIISVVYACASGPGFFGALLTFVICFAALNILFVLFWWIVALFTDESKPIEKQRRLCRIGTASIASAVCAYAGVKPHITGTEKLPQSERFLFVCNHRSMFDPLIVLDRLRAYNIAFISKPSNMKIPVAGRLSYGAGFLPIDRENDRNALKTILTAVSYLKKDFCSVGIYPEGTRSKTEELLPFQPGSFKIAQRAGVPVAIASIRGSENVSKELFRRTDVYLDILRIIPAEEVKSMNTQVLAAFASGIIAAKLEGE